MKTVLNDGSVYQEDFKPYMEEHKLAGTQHLIANLSDSASLEGLALRLKNTDLEEILNRLNGNTFPDWVQEQYRR